MHLVAAQPDRAGAAERCPNTQEPFGGPVPDPHGLTALAATAAAEISESAARLRAATAVEASRDAGDLNAAIGGVARSIAGAPALPEGRVAGLAIELAERVGLLALDITVEATLVGCDRSPLPPGEQRSRSERAAHMLTLGLAAVRDTLDRLEAATAALDDFPGRCDGVQAA